MSAWPFDAVRPPSTGMCNSVEERRVGTGEERDDGGDLSRLAQRGSLGRDFTQDRVAERRAGMNGVDPESAAREANRNRDARVVGQQVRASGLLGHSIHVPVGGEPVRSGGPKDRARTRDHGHAAGMLLCQGSLIFRVPRAGARVAYRPT
jgi:hypothetical protein